MKMRIIKIEGCKTCKEVLVYLDRDEQLGDHISIVAWHSTADGEYIQNGILQLKADADQGNIAENIIKDFSETSALEFAKTAVF